MESIFGFVPFNPVNINFSIFNENWPRFNICSEINFTVNSPLVLCILSSVNGKPTGVLNVFCDHAHLTWKHVNNIPSCSLSNITKGPQYAVTSDFTDSAKPI